MTASLDFAQPWVLLLLPLALLPLLQRRRDALDFSSLSWLPDDRAGQLIGILWRALAVLAILAIVLALCGPGRPETEVMRSGRGAEILVLMDRSRSMDLRMLPPDWRTLDPVVVTQQAWSRGPQKSQVARELLAKFVAQRADDRFALMFFSAAPIMVVPFTQHDEVVQAGITAGGVGRGLSETDVGAALLAAIGEFDQRSYSGSRIILLVSDGGAQLDAETRQRIQAGLLRNRIGLYWFYLRSINSPNLEAVDASEALPEIALHRFFQGLHTPYRAYQAEEPEDLAKAVAEVGRQQSFPLDYAEQIPRLDFSRYCLAVAALACLLLLLYHAMHVRRWS
jgi:mxaC protein